METADIYRLLNENPAFALATVDGGAPRVRGMLLYEAGPDGIVFHTGAFKDVHRQILADPRVELYFLSPGSFTEVRINAEIEIVESRDKKVEIANHPTRDFVRKWMESGDLEEFFQNFIVYKLKNPKASVWTMETNFEPKNWREI